MDKILLLKVLKPQGLKGEMKCKTFSQDKDMIENLKSVFVGDVEYLVAKAVLRLGFVYISLENINRIEDAEKFRNKEFFVAKQDFGELPQNSFFITDLIGCSILDEEGEKLSVVEDVVNYGTADFLVLSSRGVKANCLFSTKIFKKILPEQKMLITNKKEFESQLIFE